MIEFYQDINGMYHYFNTDTNTMNTSCMIHTLLEVVQLAINEPIVNPLKNYYGQDYYTLTDDTSIASLIVIHSLLHSCLKSDLPTLHLHYPELFI